MSEDTTTQPVIADTNAAATPAVEGKDARTNGGDDLDNLLSQYDEQTTRPVATQTPEPKPGATPDPNATLAQIQSFVSEAQNIQFKRDMGETVKAVRGDLPSDVFDDSLVEGWLNAEASKDPRLSKAWLERNANPKAFEQVRSALAKNFAKKFSKLPDRNATEDREAVSAAVRGASTRTPEGKTPSYGTMSDADLAREKDKLFG